MTRLWIFHWHLAEMHLALFQLQCRTYAEALTDWGNL